MACIWIFNPRLTVAKITRHGGTLGSRIPIEVLFRATEIYVHASDGVVKTKDKATHLSKHDIKDRQHLFLDTVNRTYRIVNPAFVPGNLDPSSARVMATLKKRGWRQWHPTTKHESQSN
jgi:hypothetical protein